MVIKNIKDQIINIDDFLAISCPIFADIVNRLGPCTLLSYPIDHFNTIIRSIIGQQLSTYAARSIQNKLLNRIDKITPQNIAKLSLDELRELGLSRAKAQTVTLLSSLIINKQLNFKKISKLSDDEVMSELTAIKGIGNWTAHMFLIFGLRRLDVFAPGDAGLQKAVKILYGDNAIIKDIFDRWIPYRSIASWYLWRFLDNR
jgi:DNA-3-methyladenine glycosylase II